MYALYDHPQIFPVQAKISKVRPVFPVFPILMTMLNFNIFQSFVTKESYKINHKLDCDSKCFIYLFSCKTCGLQHVGSTVERFRFRWNNNKNCQMEAAQGGNFFR